MKTCVIITITGAKVLCFHQYKHKKERFPKKSPFILM